MGDLSGGACQGEEDAKGMRRDAGAHEMHLGYSMII